MKYFTCEEFNPSEATLAIVRQIAHAYRVMQDDDTPVACCMN